ncbi:NADP-dependent oxidoreductase [Luteibacter aegosomaticola]|uniref:NADP-dependent oxidoreductase n=1 Tax=Luteibacter aegosomaticola TaxID=2911538 RepID=UPI001FF76BCB|nr:NADP-dependent oxidoreductase [Luteibacter aegosomaticola]UPG91702.1 NADP-dependent oxidoreductase [Luteibacter aegosomaticola]
MKAAWIADANAGDLSIRVGEIDAPAPADDRLLIDVEAVGLTFAEPTWVTNGATPLADGSRRPLPVVIGHEFAGTVAQVGSATHGFSVGDRVVGLIDFWRNGAAAEQASVLPGEVAKLPDRVTSVDASTLPIGALTAWQAFFDHARLATGETVLVHGGAGAVGTFAIQIAKAAGARVVATARGGEAVALCLALGADVAIDTETQRFEDFAGHVDVVFDTVGRDLLERSWRFVKPAARLVTISGEAEDAPSPERAASLGIEAYWFIVRPDAAQLGEIAQWVADGRIKAQVDLVYALADAAKAFAEAPGRKKRGKTVLTI